MLIERNIQQKHVNARLAENAQIRTFRELRDQLFYLACRRTARFGNAGSLYLSISRTDVRIEAGSRSGDCVLGNGRLWRKDQGRFVVIERFDQLDVVEIAMRILELVERRRRNN